MQHENQCAMHSLTDLKGATMQNMPTPIGRSLDTENVSQFAADAMPVMTVQAKGWGNPAPARRPLPDTFYANQVPETLPVPPAQPYVNPAPPRYPTPPLQYEVIPTAPVKHDAGVGHANSLQRQYTDAWHHEALAQHLQMNDGMSVSLPMRQEAQHHPMREIVPMSSGIDAGMGTPPNLTVLWS
jgi:hypothetical protein